MGLTNREGEVSAGSGVSLVKITDLNQLPDKLSKIPVGVLLLDSDGTTRNGRKSLLRGRPGEVPRSSLEMVEGLIGRGWQVAVVTNQPAEGHQIARFWGRIRQYPYFPEVWRRMSVPVFGAGWDFLWNRAKTWQSTLVKVLVWMEDLEMLRMGIGSLVMVGDRQGDVDFIERLKAEMKQRVIDVSPCLMFKLPGLEDSSSMLVRRLAPLVP